MLDINGLIKRLANTDANETFDPLTDSLEALRNYLSTAIMGQLGFKDQWCATPIAQLTIAAAAADLTLPNIVFPAGFAPADSVINAVYLMFKCRKIENTNVADNAINGAAHTWRVKAAAGAWGVDDVVGITLADNQWYTEAAGFEGGDMITGNVDIRGEVDDVDNATYNVMGEQTNRADAPHVDGNNLILHDVYVGFRVYFTVA